MTSNFIIFLFLVNIVLFLAKTSLCVNVKKNVDDNRDDNGDTSDDVKDESLDIPADSEPNNITCTRRMNNQMHEIKNAHYRQFPFMASIMSYQNEHLCSGVVISNGLILTTASCVQKPASYVLLNATKSKKDDTTVPLHIIKTEKFPTYSNAQNENDVGLIYTEKHNASIATKIRLSNFTATRNILDIEVIGYGLNADVGDVKELQYVGLENRIGPGPDPEFKDSLHGYIDCIDTKVLTCFKDIGGPAIFNNELIGIVTKGDVKCFKEITSSYAINKKLVDILPTYTFRTWIDEKIVKNEDLDKEALSTYPHGPKATRARHDLKLMRDEMLRAVRARDGGYFRGAATELYLKTPLHLVETIVFLICYSLK